MPWITDVHFTDADGDLGNFELLQDLVYQDWSGKLWTVPKTSSSDLSSIPPFLRWLFSKTVLGKAPWLHDYLYRHQPQGVTREIADRLYYEGGIDEGLNLTGWRFKFHRVKCYSLYLGLRAGGGATWAIKKLKRGKGASGNDG